MTGLVTDTIDPDELDDRNETPQCEVIKHQRPFPLLSLALHWIDELTGNPEWKLAYLQMSAWQTHSWIPRPSLYFVKRNQNLV